MSRPRTPTTDARPKKKRPIRRTTKSTARPTKRTGDVGSKPRAPRAPKMPVEPGTEAVVADVVQGALGGKAIRHLRGLGHHIDPVVQIGKDGLSEAVVAATKQALRTHELVKVKVLSESPVDRKEAGPELAEKTGAVLAQLLGRTVLLYKRHPNKPKIVLPT